MGAETQNQRLAGNSVSRAQLSQDLRATRREGLDSRLRSDEGRRRRMSALREGGGSPQREEAPAEALVSRLQSEIGPQVGEASMFPGERPGQQNAPIPPGFEEAMYRRGDITRERDRSGRREELYNQFAQARAQRGGKEIAPGGAVERGAGLFGVSFGGAGQPRSGIAFGPGRANRMPEPGSPEYQQLVARMRDMGR